METKVGIRNGKPIELHRHAVPSSGDVRRVHLAGEWHWATDQHVVDGVEHGNNAERAAILGLKSIREPRERAARVTQTAESDADRLIRLKAEVEALTAILEASKALADAELAAVFEAAEADEARAYAVGKVGK
jgi:hypothetical protein